MMAVDAKDRTASCTSACNARCTCNANAACSATRSRTGRAPVIYDGSAACIYTADTCVAHASAARTYSAAGAGQRECQEHARAENYVGVSPEYDEH